MKHLTTLALCLLLVACGGGGSGAAPDDGDPLPDPTEPSDDTVITQVVEQCGVDHLAEILAALELFQGFVDPSSGAPPIELTQANTNLNLGRVGFTLDADGDESADFDGTIEIQTSTGSSINLTPIVLSVGADLDAILDALPDDARIVTSFDGALPPGMDEPAPLDPIQLAGTLTTQLVPGLDPNLVSGEIESTDSACRMWIAFDDIPVDQLLIDPDSGTYPVGVFDVEIENATELLVGDVTFDGTKVVMVSVAQQGYLPLDYTYDLETQVLTPVGS